MVQVCTAQSKGEHLRPHLRPCIQDATPFNGTQEAGTQKN